jgi:hypothetical protein
LAKLWNDYTVAWFVQALCWRRVPFPLEVLDIPIALILPAALWPWRRLNHFTEMSIRNLPGSKGWPRVDTSLPSISRLSRNCGILEVSNQYVLLRPITARAVLFLTKIRKMNNKARIYFPIWQNVIVHSIDFVLFKMALFHLYTPNDNFKEKKANTNMKAAYVGL